MSDEQNAERVGRRAAALLASPGDLGAWLDLALALAAAGEEEAAARCAEALGRSASDLGQVALAVACGRWLADRGRQEEADRLAGAIAEVHCHGSPRIDSGLRARPPGPPPPAEPRPVKEPDPETAVDREIALARAEEAVDAAGLRAQERAPEKLPPTPLVGVLEPADFRELFKVMQLAERAPGDVILDVGDPADSL